MIRLEIKGNFIDISVLTFFISDCLSTKVMVDMLRGVLISSVVLVFSGMPVSSVDFDYLNNKVELINFIYIAITDRKSNIFICKKKKNNRQEIWTRDFLQIA